ncbi:Heavy metal-associated domain, HMA [Dillenia turbinata]|uniref:Heavy metal-associated domain, HMA n=1 Tax=Dillenia turbinata TaxID=194707 RepID=A0AAN8VKM9_9MAGN
MAQDVKMILKVDLHCSKCYKKVKKVLCKFPEITDQVWDEKANTVTIKVSSCNPEKIRDKICCKGGKSIKCIKIVLPTPPTTPPPTPPPTLPPTPPPTPPPKPETVHVSVSSVQVYLPIQPYPMGCSCIDCRCAWPPCPPPPPCYDGYYEEKQLWVKMLLLRESCIMHCHVNDNASLRRRHYHHHPFPYLLVERLIQLIWMQLLHIGVNGCLEFHINFCTAFDMVGGVIVSLAW